MARSRNIKPGFYKNEDLAECSVWARLLFPGLWMLADRAGRLEDRPKRIKGEIFPFDTVDVDPLLNELAQWNFIIRYEVDGVRYIQIVGFEKHQVPHIKEKDSEIPPPVEHKAQCKHSASMVQAQCKHGENTVPAPPDSLNPDSLNPESKPLAPSVRRSQPKVEFDGEKFVNVESLFQTWEKAYPAIDLRVELNKAAAWAIANPKNRKSNWAKFLTNWFSRAQDKAPRVATVPTVTSIKAWSDTMDGVYAKAKQMGLMPIAGEHWEDLKERVWDEIRKLRTAA